MNPLQHLLVFLVRCYRWVLSPAKNVLFGPMGRCRYTPSCSAYAMEAIRVWGAGKGGWIALGRILRCHPWGGCGHDPVPARTLATAKSPRVPSCHEPNPHPDFDSSPALAASPATRP